MSWLVEIDPSTLLENEPIGYEFGYCMFDKLPPLATSILKIKSDEDDNANDDNHSPQGQTLSVLEENDDNY